MTKLGITADCTSLEWSDRIRPSSDTPCIRRPKDGRELLRRRAVHSHGTKGRFRCGSTGRQSTGGEIVYVGIDTPPKPHFSLLDIVESQDDEPGLSGADIILSGGLGLGSRENFDKLHTLAHLTNASVGASRAAVAAGYASYMHQVGQTGVSVSPRVYVAFGISGAVQHLSGIIGAEKIVAVNTDPKAPIHGYSDYSVIADCGDVLDSLIRLFTEKQAEPGQLPYCRKKNQKGKHYEQTMSRAFGCPQKYIQGPGEIANLPTLSAEYGKKPFFVIDSGVMALMFDKINTAYNEAGIPFGHMVFSGESCRENIDLIKNAASGSGCDIIVGFGGGKCLDAAKFASSELNWPRIIMPTSASTDAPAAGISVLYTNDGIHIRSEKMRRPTELVLIDTEILANAPRAPVLGRNRRRTGHIF